MKRYDMDRDGLALEYQDGEWVKYEDAQAAIQAAVLAEREACAKLAESTYEATEGGGEDDSGICCYGDNSAEAIRARSKS